MRGSARRSRSLSTVTRNFSALIVRTGCDRSCVIAANRSVVRVLLFPRANELIDCIVAMLLGEEAARVL